MKDGYHSLLLAYAAGILDEAQDMIVSAHIGLSRRGRDYVRSYESLGGCMIEDYCEPVAMSESALDHVLACIDKAEEVQQPCPPKPSECDFFEEIAAFMPPPMRAQIQSLCSGQRWSHLMPGIDIFDLPLTCKQSHARLMRVKPSGRTPHHGHKGVEITLVLDGAYADESGEYTRGDLIVADEHFEHKPSACPDRGCTCMIVTTAPVRLTGLAKLLNPFLRK